MGLKYVDGFDQFQGRVGGALLTALAAAGYAVSPGITLAEGRYPNTAAIEMQVSSGSAGTSWSTRANSIRESLRGVTHDGNKWVSVGDNAMIAVTSDTISYDIAVSGATANLAAVANGGGKFVAVGQATLLVAGTDAQSWLVKAAPRPTFNLVDVAYGDGKWVAIGSENNQAAMLISIDEGQTWGVITLTATTQPLNCVTYAGGKWMVGAAGGHIITSVDGLAWSSLASGATTAISAIAFNGANWLALNGRNIRASLTGGTSWVVAAANAFPLNSVGTSLAYVDELWVAVGTAGVILTGTSPTGSVWATRNSSTTLRLNRVTPAGGAQGGWMIVGDKAAQVNGAAFIVVSLAPPTTFSRTFTTAATRVVFGFAHKATARGKLLSIGGLVDLDWPVGIEINGVRGNAVPIRNFWYYYEITIDKVAKTVSLHINDTADLVAPLPTAGVTMADFTLTWQAENGAIASLDDMYFLDNDATNDETLIDRLKPIRIPIREVDADVSVEWEGSNGDPHWSLVGMLPPSEGTYIISSTSGAQDLFTSSTPLPEGAGTVGMPILAVGVVALAKKSDLDHRQLGMVVGARGPDQLEVIDDTLSMNPEYSYSVFERAPGGAAWDATNVVTTPFGVAVRP